MNEKKSVGVPERPRGRSRQLLEDLKERRAYWKLKVETLDRTLWRTSCERACGTVVGQGSDWINECKNDFVHSVLDWGQGNKYKCKSMKTRFNVGPLHRLALSRPIRIYMAVKNTTIFCNIQVVSVYTNVSANYMFRPLLVRPSSGWIQWSEELYNNAI